MAIYKPPKARWPLAVLVGVIGILVGIGIGFLLGSEDPDPSEGVRLVKQELIGAASGLEIAGIEYEEAVDETGVVKEAEYEGSLDALESSRTRFETVAEALATLAPAQADEIAAAYDEIEGAMREEAPVDEVLELLDELSGSLKGESG